MMALSNGAQSWTFPTTAAAPPGFQPGHSHIPPPDVWRDSDGVLNYFLVVSSAQDAIQVCAQSSFCFAALIHGRP